MFVSSLIFGPQTGGSAGIYRSWTVNVSPRQSVRPGHSFEQWNPVSGAGYAVGARTIAHHRIARLSTNDPLFAVIQVVNRSASSGTVTG